MYSAAQGWHGVREETSQRAQAAEAQEPALLLFTLTPVGTQAQLPRGIQGCRRQAEPVVGAMIVDGMGGSL